MTNCGTAGRLAKNCDLIGISTKVGNIGMNPLKGRHHVQHAHVASRLVCVQAEETQSGQPIVDGHQYHIAPGH